MSYPPGQGNYGQPVPYPSIHTQVVAQPYRSSTAHLVLAWIAAVLTVGYMLPWAIAATRNKSNTAVIALINLLLGWSLVGWIVALVMSVTSEPQPMVYVNTAMTPGHYPNYGQYAPPPALPPNWSQPGEPPAVPPPYDSHPWQRPTDGYR